jgi:hypothetical protein
MLLKLLAAGRANARRGMPMKKEGTPNLKRSLAVGQRRSPPASLKFYRNNAAVVNDRCRSNAASSNDRCRKKRRNLLASMAGPTTGR